LQLPSQAVALVGPNYLIKYRTLGNEEYTGSSISVGYPDIVSGANVDTDSVVTRAYFADTNGVYRVYDVSDTVTPGATSISIPDSLQVQWAVEDGTRGRISAVNYEPSTGIKYYKLYNGVGSASSIVISGNVLSEFKSGSTIITPFIYVSDAIGYTGYLEVAGAALSGGNTELTVTWSSSFPGFTSGESVEFYPAAYSTLKETDTTFANVSRDDINRILGSGYYAGDYDVLGTGADTSVYVEFCPYVYKSAKMNISGGTITVAGGNLDDYIKIGDRIWVIDTGGANTGAFRAIKVTPDVVTLDSSASAVVDGYFVAGRYLQVSTSLSYNILHTAAIGGTEIDSCRFLVSYKALRTDGANTLQQIDSVQDAYDDLGLAIPGNPLGLAAYIAISSSGGYPVYYMRIASNDTSGYADAESALQGVSGPYYIVPLSQEPAVHALFEAHVDTMANDDNQQERMVLINHKLYVYEARKSGTTDGTFTDGNTFRVSGDITSSISMGNTLNITFDDSEGYDDSEELTVQSSSYSGGYTTIELTSSFSDYALFNSDTGRTWEIRTAALSKTGQANYIADYARGYLNRRVVLIWPDFVEYSYTLNEAGDDPYADTETEYEDEEIPGYYVSAGLSSLASSRSDPSRPLNRVQLGLFTGTVHSNDYFIPYDLNVMAGGGVMIIIEQTTSGPLQVRDQLTTDVSAEETIQFSSVTALDFGSSLLRSTLMPIVGIYKQDDVFYSKLRMYLNSGIQFLVGNKIWKGAKILNISASGSNVSVDISVELYGVAKTITITLKV
jgi:hypothetical protein